MAVRPLTKIANPFEGAGVEVYLWETCANGDTGQPLLLPQHADKTIQVIGTWGVAGSITMQGSCMIGSPSWLPVTDPQGGVITKTTDSIEAILENPYQIRPIITAGDGTTDLDVYVVVKRN